MGRGSAPSGLRCRVFSPLHHPCASGRGTPWSQAPGPRWNSGRQGQKKLVLRAESQSEGVSTPRPTPSRGHGTLTSLASRPQVRERDLPFVTHTLSSEFTILRVINGETVAAENLGITNGFVKSKMGELGSVQGRP